MALTSGTYEKHNSLSKETATRNHVKGHIIKTRLTVSTKAPAMPSPSVFPISESMQTKGCTLGRQLPKPCLETAFPKTDSPLGTYSAFPVFPASSPRLLYPPRPVIKLAMTSSSVTFWT